MTVNSHANSVPERYAACVEYDGAGFSGWQSQVGTQTVQDAVERAVSFVANHPVRVVCAGRTDTGVHATGQMIHFDSDARRTRQNWIRGVNTRLPAGIAIPWIQTVHSGFHARFEARRRHYRYIILNQKVKPALFRDQVTWEYRPLDPGRMSVAAQHLLGKHDFSAYRAMACQSKSPVRTLYRLDVKAHQRWICLDLEADGFLHHMVRNIAGVLIQIGCGERPVAFSAEVLESRDRRAGGVTASATGLYLTRVQYDSKYGLPEPSPSPTFW